MTEIEPSPELSDDAAISEVRFPTRIRNSLLAAGIKTVGEAREMSDRALLALPDFGTTSVAQLRELIGLSSTEGVRPGTKKHS
jgi:DNA-directed RNA polymerase alpha subunit